MKNFLKILIPLLFCFTANSQSITRLTGDTTIANSNNGATLFQIKNNTAYRTGGYLQNYLQGRTKWNYAIDSVWVGGGNIYFARAAHDTTVISLSSATVGWGNITGTLSAQTDLQNALNAKLSNINGLVVAGSGIGVTGSGTAISPYSIAFTGTVVTSVSGTANRITSTGGTTPVIDISSTFEGLLGKVANPLSQFATTTSAQLAGVISDESGTNKLMYSDGGTMSNTLLTNTTLGGITTITASYNSCNCIVALGQDTLTGRIYRKTASAGGVTSVAPGFGTDFSTITSTGSVIVDTTSGGVLSWVRGKKIADSLASFLSSYVPTARTLTHSSGFGTIVTGGTQDMSANRTWSYLTDSTSGGLLSWVRGKKLADSLGVIIATKGIGSVTSVAPGYGLNFTTITGSGSVISDTFAMATRARVQKPIDSLDAAIVAGYVPVTRTVAGFALSSNVTLASLTIGTGLTLSSGTTYNGSTALTLSAGDLSATYWALSGSYPVAGSETGSFLGSINNVSLRIRSNNVEVAKFDSTGSELYLENGLNPLISLKQKVTSKEWQIRGNLGNGSSSQNFNIYDATNSKIAINIADYRHIAFGNVTAIPTSSQIYGFGGSAGANLDMRPDSLVSDDANIEVENAAYDDGSSPFLGFGLAMEHSGNKATGNTFVYSNKNLSQLRFTATTNLIKVINNASLRFGTNSTEYMVLDSNGRLGIGNKLPTYTLDVTGTSRITSTFYLSGNTYNSGAALVGLAIDTLTGIVYRKTASGGSGVTSVASGFGTTFSTITSTGTVVGDSTSGGFESWVRGLKVKDSLIAWSNSTFVPQTRTVAGFALSSNVTLANLTATDGTLTFSGTYNGSTARTIGLNLGNTNNWTAAINEAKGADIASGTTTDIGAATGNYIDVTGTTTITGLGTVQAGTRRIVRFTGALTLTHNATSLILPGAANITTVAGDVATFVSLGSGNWRCTNYTKTTWTGTGGQVFATTPTIATPDITTGFTIGTAAASGKFIIGNGTNFVASTSTIPTDAGSTAGKILRSDGTNYVLSTPTFANTATSNKVLVGDGTNFVLSTPTIPLTSSPSAGKIMIGDGTNWVASTPTYPNASATTRKIIVSDGTNWIASTETYAVPGTSGNVLTSDGTNWTSAAPVVTASSTNTFTNKRWTARVGSTTSSGTPTINTDNTDIYKLTAQAAAITSFTTNLSGTPVDGDALEIQITDDGTARAITWGTSFVSGTVSLPTTTVISTTLTIDFRYYSTSSFGNNKYVCVAYY